MVRINNIRFELDEEFCKEAICRKLNIQKSDLKGFKLTKKSTDARKKSDIHYIYSIIAELNNEHLYEKRKNFQLYEEEHYSFEYKTKNIKNPIIVGSGPAGLFSALCLAMAGAEPIVLERGSQIDKRIKAVENFWNGGGLNCETNVQFGEGGAGTFSDGKLTTGINDKRLSFIKELFVKFGAPDEILYSSKPHIGTDKLITVVKNIRNEIIALGGRFEFDTKLEEIIEEDGKIKGAVIKKNNTKTEILCDNIILATGHSARDTFEMLKQKGVKMQRKTFSIGARIEHLQSDIGYAQYGNIYKKLSPADYKLSVRTKSGRGVYTFCMCPGGYVVASASEENSVVTNGMSYFSRGGKNANSAVLVTVNPEDISGDDVLGGVILQREIEQRAFIAGGKNYSAPCQTVGDFLSDKCSQSFGAVVGSFRPGVKLCNIRDIFPEFINEAIAEAIPLLDKKLKGFANPDALLTAPETRSSSPVRILRNGDFQSNIKGLYPCGEGAGYAGGIMSAALDGIKCAESLIQRSG